MTDTGDHDALRRLTERLDDAAARAEALLSDSLRAAAAATDPDPDPDPDATADRLRPPPAGWQRPAEDPRARQRWLDRDELELLLSIVAGLRDRIPADLRARLSDALRELFTAIRAVIDWYLERSERRAAGPAEVRDIPIL